MGKDVEIHLDGTVDATPGQIWDTIATGPGISAWQIGRTTIDGHTLHTAFGDHPIPDATITAHDPPHRFATHTGTAADGRFLATEHLIEGRDHTTTVLRTVTSGFLPGDDWADEYEAMQHGTRLFFATLLEYLRHFPGRPTTTVTAFGPPVTDWPTTWRHLHDARPAGTVYATSPHTLGVRTDHGLYRFIRGFHGTLVADHTLVTPDHTDWTAFLATL